MIHIDVEKRDGAYTFFKSAGHAGFAGVGEDIVCSAVSILVINTANSIISFCRDAVSVDADDAKGEISIRFDETPGHDATLLMDSMMLGLGGVAEEYKDFVKINFQEV